jgi:hypothetical protein
MIRSNPEREADLQAAAEEMERAGSGIAADSGVDPYRFILRVIRNAPIPPPPTDLAVEMERLTRDHEEDAAVEVWTVRVAFALVLAAAGLVIRLVAAAAAPALIGLWSAIPWSTLLPAAIILFSVAALDAAVSRSRSGRRTA